MTGSIYMAANGALAYQKRLEILSNNLANVNTVGFKQEKSCFQSYYLTEALHNGNQMTAHTAATQAPAFWFRHDTRTDLSSGPLKNTGNRYDLAITGSGFFCVQAPQEIQYTRRGDFTIDASGLLVTQEGWPVLGESGEIVVASQAGTTDVHGHEFLVDEAGTVSVDGNIVGKLRIVEFDDSVSLKKAGNTFFTPSVPGGEESAAHDFRISQGVVELSNVNAVHMMTELIEVLRGYESYQKMIRSVDEMNSQLIHEVAGTS